ncbi:MAG: 1,4-dihydroxy-2-naphthoate octaprenyltransferase [Bacteroidaceae bacterium]|nr:1,4-dihydroxy-2-naphthoate octaprenyltransferase [Bacteroidaceae bacterium]
MINNNNIKSNPPSPLGEGAGVRLLKPWLLAARPKTLTGAMIPVILGSALAYHDGAMKWSLVLCCALFAGFMQIAANMINDLYDFQKGTDREDRLGPERACAQGWITPKAMRRGIAVVLCLASLAGLAALLLCWKDLPYQGIELLLTGVACIIFAFLYTYGLSYLGLGDILVLVFFGLVPVCGTYYIQAHAITAPAILLGFISGISIDALLVINNYRDREQDRISGKRTIIVLGGERFGRYLYLLIGPIVAVLSILLGYLIDGNILYFQIAAYVYLALHINAWGQLNKIRSGKALNKVLGLTSMNMFLLALMLAAAIVYCTL